MYIEYSWYIVLMSNISAYDCLDASVNDNNRFWILLSFFKSENTD